MKFGKAIQEKLKYVHYNPVEAGLFYFLTIMLLAVLQILQVEKGTWMMF